MNALAADWFPEANRLDRRVGAGRGGCRAADRGAARGRRQAASAKRLERLCRRRRRADVDGHAAGARPHREDDRPRGGRHHRVDAVERRHRRAQADDAEGGSDPVPGGSARRHVARERRRLHFRARRRRCGPRRRRRQVQRRGARQAADRQSGRRPAVHQRDRRGHAAAAARRRISRRCSS